MENVQHLDFDLVGDQFQRVGHIPGGRVVSIAESRRQDQDFFHTLTLARSGDNLVAIVLNSVHIFQPPYVEQEKTLTPRVEEWNKASRAVSALIIGMFSI